MKWLHDSVLKRMILVATVEAGLLWCMFAAAQQLYTGMGVYWMLLFVLIAASDWAVATLYGACFVIDPKEANHLFKSVLKCDKVAVVNLYKKDL